MNITTILFDLDGTLLPMDQDQFTNYYFGFLAKKAAPYGYKAEELIKAIWGGTKAMAKNDGSVTNEERFWQYFCSIFGDGAIEHKSVFEEFYRNEFQKAQVCCPLNPKAKETVDLVHELGFRTALATNPIFPSVATESRIKWAGLEESDFELFTTYEMIGYSKPNLEYYKEIMRRLNVTPEECLMVGNDVSEDMVVQQLGCKVFLLTDCIINKNDVDINNFPHGDFEDLKTFIKNLKK